jgi:hypothetical protein
MEQAQTAVKYASINGAWPAELPTITNREAIELVRRLYRKFMGRKVTVPLRIATGNRLTWHRGDRFDVNPNRVAWRENHRPGWHDIVHLLSHCVHGRKYPAHQPHAATHAWTERCMIEHVVSSGWLEGKLKRPARPKKPPPTAGETRSRGWADRVRPCMPAWRRRYRFEEDR